MRDSFEVKVGLHQSSVPSPILFNIILDVLTEDVRVGTHTMRQDVC